MNSSEAFKLNDFCWDLPLWDYLVKEISSVFRLTKEETTKLSESSTAKIIATIPFAANCNNPEKTAISHLCLYMAEIQGFHKFCDHLPEDDENIFHRLEFISDFDGGDKKIIHHGICLLALIMLEGYKKSFASDEKLGIYNPLVSGVWNYKTQKNYLLWEISKTTVYSLDFFINPYADLGW